MKQFGSYKVRVKLEHGLRALLLLFVVLPTLAGRSSEAASLRHGDWTNASFFPLAVWLQNPARAEQYRQAGINTYVGLWKGPTPTQLAALHKAGMRLVCHQNEVALADTNSSIIIAWMHDDEPDNAQSLGEGKGWGPPVAPEIIVRDYKKLRERDPSRPVLLNLGQGVAWDAWHGRGVRTRHPEDYPKYIEGCDVVSFDIYPAVHEHPDVAGKLSMVAKGVERLAQWSEGRKRIWNCLECTRIGNVNVKPTPHQVRAEAWMSIIHGSRGLIYFVHQFKPEFREAALLDDPEMLAGVSRLNREIQGLAQVINTGETLAGVEWPKESLAVMPRRHNGADYLFCVEMRGEKTKASVRVPAWANGTSAQVLGENRGVELKKGTLEDTFEPWAVHLYRFGH